MNLQFRNNGLEIEGYINVTNRPSELLSDKEGNFIEIVRSGCWSKAIKKRTIDLLYNHKADRKLGDTNTNLELIEDSIGLRFRAFITDYQIIESARKGLLKSCSFGFIPVKHTKKFIDGIEHRYLEEIELYEVSLLDIAPAYSGCVINIRSQEQEFEYQVRDINIEELEKSEIIEEVKDVLENPKSLEDDISEAQEEILEQEYNKFGDFKLWFWLQQNKRA